MNGANNYLDFRDVELTPDEWVLDRGRILKGEWNVLAGEGGMGKTTLLAAWIAELSQADVKVLYLGERNPKSMLKRMLAAGVDLDYVRSLNLSDFADIKSSVTVIERAVSDGFEIVILDPLSHFLPVDADSHNDTKMRAVARPLADLVQNTGLTILGLVHLNKSEGSSPIHRLTGSAWFKDFPGNVVGLGVNPHNDAQRALVLLKTNADEGTMRRSLLYDGKLVDVGTQERSIKAMRAVYVGESALGKDDVWPRTKPGPKPERKAEAVDFLTRALAGDGVEERTLEADAEALGIAWSTVRRAADELGVVKKPGSFGGAWVYRLPEAA